MTQPDPMTDTELKRYREYLNNGFLEFAIGSVILVPTLFELFHFPVGVPLVLLLAFPITRWNKWFVYPRMGYAAFQETFVKREKRLASIILIGLIVVIPVLIAFWGMQVHPPRLSHPHHNDELINQVLLICTGTISALVIAAVAILRGEKRFFLFSLLQLTVWVSFLGVPLKPVYSFLAIGLSMTGWGCVVLNRFLKAHPPIGKNVEEPVSPAVESEWKERQEKDQKLFERYNSNGGFEFLIAIFIWFICDSSYTAQAVKPYDSDDGGIKLILFWVAMILMMLWDRLIVRKRLGKDEYKRVSLIRQVRLKPWLLLISIVPLSCYMTLIISNGGGWPGTILFGKSVVHNYFDLIFLAFLLGYTIVLDLMTEASKFFRLALVLVSPYLILSFLNYPKWYCLMITACIAIIAAIMNGVRFIRTNPRRIGDIS